MGLIFQDKLISNKLIELSNKFHDSFINEYYKLRNELFSVLYQEFYSKLNNEIEDNIKNLIENKNGTYV